MKYFLQLMYDGQNYAGWQRQPNATGVQEVVEDRLSRMLQTSIDVVGCGRTDVGVHAMDYFAHTEADEVLDETFLFRLNNFLPSDIAVMKIWLMHDDAHARFDAIERSYIYHIHFIKNPFRDGYSFYYRRAMDIKVTSLNVFAQKLLTYNDFQTFAKVHSDVHHYRCKLSRCEWIATPHGLELHVTSDRFLRGMVRLIAGACLRYAEEKISLTDLEMAMATGEQLDASWSVPAHGLFLTEVKFPYL